jgi:hypothetical protein
MHWDIPDFGQRVDLKARFNAKNVLKLEPNMDVYPGLNLGLHNFGAHLGFRYFFYRWFWTIWKLGTYS